MNAGWLRMILEIEDDRWTQALPDAAGLIEEALCVALSGNRPDARPVEVGVRLVDDTTIRGLNRDWRGQDKATNVLSFPLGDPVGAIADPDFPWLIGDIVMSYDTVAAETTRDAKPLEHHVVHLAVHAALHLIGHDHVDEAEAEAMEAAETRLLANLGVPDPYRADSPGMGDPA